MMNSALKVFRNVKKEVGCKLIRVDCDPIMTGYYEKHGFKSIAFNKEKKPATNDCFYLNKLSGPEEPEPLP